MYIKTKWGKLSIFPHSPPNLPKEGKPLDRTAFNNQLQKFKLLKMLSITNLSGLNCLNKSVLIPHVFILQLVFSLHNKSWASFHVNRSTFKAF